MSIRSVHSLSGASSPQLSPIVDGLDDRLANLQLDPLELPSAASTDSSESKISPISSIGENGPSSSAEPSLAETASLSTPDAWTQAVIASWNTLQIATRSDPSIPPHTLYPSQYKEHPNAKYVRPIINTQTGEPWELCGNWITNPHDPDQTVAVFQYPSAYQSLSHWSLIHQHKLQMIDLTTAEDSLALGITRENFRCYPPFDEKTYTFPTLKLDLKCFKKDGPFGYYRIRKPDGKKFESVVFHYCFWRDGGVIDIQDLDPLVDYVLTSDKKK